MVALLTLAGLTIVIGSICGIAALIRIDALKGRIDLLEKDVARLRSPKPAAKPSPAEWPSHEVETVPPPVTGPAYMPPVSPERFRVAPDLATSEVNPSVPVSSAASPQLLVSREAVATGEPVATPKPVAAAESSEPGFFERLTASWPTSLPSFEEFIGTKGIWWVGMLMFLVGSAFFLKYAYDNAWIGERGRLAIGVAFSCAALGVGEHFRRKRWDLPSQVLTGGGVAGFYVCIYFAFRIYGFIDAGFAMTLASLNTLFAVSLAVLRDAQPIAVLALIGGYLSPFLFSTGENRPYALFIYVAILNCIAFGSAYFRSWPLLERMALMATGLLYQGWYMKFYQPDQLAPALTFSSLFYAMFLVIPVVHSLRTKQAGDHIKLVILAVNQLFWLCHFCAVLFDVNRNALGAIMLLQAGAVGALLRIWSLRVGPYTAHAQVMLAIFLSLLTLVAPVLFKFRVLAITWATEGVIFCLIGVRFRQVLSRIAGFAAFVISGAYLAYHLPLHGAAFTLLFNASFGSWVFLVAALCVAGMVLRTNTELFHPIEAYEATAVGYAAFVVACSILSLEINDFWRFSSSQQHAVYAYCSLAVLWAVQAVSAAWIGVRFQQVVYRLTGLVILCISGACLLLHLPLHTTPFSAIFNVPFISWAAVISAMCAAALIYRANSDYFDPNEEYVPTGVGFAAFLAACALLSFELHDFWRFSELSRAALYDYCSLSLLWAVQAMAAAAIGVRFRQALYRVTALCGFVASVIFLSAHYPFHTAAFTPVLNLPFVTWALLVAILVAACLVYRKNASLIGPSESHVPTVLALAAFAISCAILSIEIVDFWKLSGYDHHAAHACSSLVFLWALIGLGVHYVLLNDRFEALAVLEWLVYLIGAGVFLYGLVESRLPSPVLAMNSVFLSRFAFVVSVWIASRRIRPFNAWPAGMVYEHVGHAFLALLVAVELFRWGTYTSLISRRMAIALISAAWGLQAFLLIWVGLATANRPRRIAGFVLFSLTIAKVLLLDTSGLEKVYRIVSWLACGALLLAAGYFYQRYKPLLFGDNDKIDPIRPDEPRLTP